MCDKFNWYMSNLKLQDLAQLLLLVLPAARYQQLNWFASVATGSLSLLKGTDQVASDLEPATARLTITCHMHVHVLNPITSLPAMTTHALGPTTFRTLAMCNVDDNQLSNNANGLRATLP